MSLLWLLLVTAVSLLVAPIVARRWEKRLVWPYVDDATLPRTSYIAETVEAARMLGFVPQGVFRDGKGRIYRIRYEMWMAPQGDTLLLIGGGTLAGLSVNGSWLFTRLADGRCIASIDDEAGREHDLTGTIDETVYPRTTFEALLASHRRAVIDTGASPVAYLDPVVEHRGLLTRRIEMLVDGGYAAFLGQERWRYTARGAVIATLAAYRRGVSQGMRASRG